MRVLVVAGKFNEEGGRPSGYAEKLFEGWPGSIGWMTFKNGGTIESLYKLKEDIGRYWFDVVVWMPDIPNDVPKMVDDLKAIAPRILLVTSKNNLEGKYSLQDLVRRMLKVKSNLMIEITHEGHLQFEATILDPLGNRYCNKYMDPEVVGQVLLERIQFLCTLSRIGSLRVGDAREVPQKEEFYGHIRRYADVYHELIHGVNPERMLGNASFRCTQGGFPSYKDGERLFVSRRNVDKRDIGQNGFVEVRPSLDHGLVEYLGEHKPSVDSAIQIALYEAMPLVRFMVHAHVYINGAPMTRRVIPCGCMEEVYDTLKAVEDIRSTRRSERSYQINLKGHGSLVLAASEEDLVDIPYMPRPAPEDQFEFRS